jgi:hypothetical protein
MGCFVRLVLVIHVARCTPSQSASDGMMVRVMASHTAHEGASQTTLRGSRIGRDECARQCDNKNKS